MLNHKDRGNEGSPLYFLDMSIFNLATSFKYKTRDFKTHLKLAMLLEEKHFYECCYGSEMKVNYNNCLYNSIIYHILSHKDDKFGTVITTTLSSQNKIALDSSKEEEINAICVQRNFGSNATEAQKLKALDEEYQQLISSGQNVKAEQIQLLYQFKAKKISNVYYFFFFYFKLKKIK